MSALWDSMEHVLASPQLPWIILWLGLATLTVGLIVLTRTNWGQSHPLRKCAVLSLLAHLLLAAYATTIQIVSASAGSADGRADRGPVSVILVHETADDAASAKTEPWDKIVSAVPLSGPEGLALAASEPLTPADSPRPELLRQPVPTVEPLLERATADLSPAPKPLPEPVPSAVAQLEPTVKPAEPIETAAPPKPQSDPLAKPDAPTPDRQALARTDPAANGDANPSDPARRPLMQVPGPESLQLPADPPAAASTNSVATGDGDSAAHGSKPANLPTEATNGAVSAVGPTPITGTSDGNQVADSPVNGGTDSGAVAHSGPDIYKDRTASDRAAVLLRRGGSPETEAAVQGALKWLAANQSPDGHWDADKFGAGREMAVLGHDRHGAGARAHTGVTGLALLALLGSGNTHRTGPYALNVRHGLEYLLAVQGRDGNLGGEAETFAFMYCHGMATFAMSEAYAMSGDKRLEQPLHWAITYTITAQHPTTGGWRYQPQETGDTSQLGWQLMSLKSAELAGVPMPQHTRDGAVRFLKSVAAGNYGGLASYRPAEQYSPSMTAEALVCRQFLGMARENPAADEAGDFLLRDLPSKDKVNLYYWYYGTLGMYQLQGTHWNRWNQALQGALVGQQQTDGDLAGSWDPKCIWGGYGGRVYSTSMSALCLEVYYRFLPLYNDPAVEARRAKDVPK